MKVIGIQTPVLKSGDNLSKVLLENSQIELRDIICISSKALATVEGAAIDLQTLQVCNEAKKLSEEHGASKSPEFYQAVIEETARMNGTIIQSVAGVVLTELKPKGMEGSFLVPNAGLDSSNIEEGYVIGWSLDPVESVKKLQSKLGNIGIILTDSGLSPRRRGVTAFAIACAGIDPILSIVGKKDIFGGQMRITEEAIADQLATIANTVMGNAGQSTPAAIIRGHRLESSEYCGWVPGIKREDDLYHGVI